MQPQLPPNALIDVLADRMGTVARIGTTANHKRQLLRRKHLGDVADEATAAIATGEVTALQAALLSVDLLSFELCEG